GERANQSVRRAGGQAAEHERREAVAQVGQGSPSVSGCNENAPGFGPRGGNERFEWSGRQDLNLRPPPLQGGALPGCATPRPQGSMEFTAHAFYTMRSDRSRRFRASSPRPCPRSVRVLGLQDREEPFEIPPQRPKHLFAIRPAERELHLFL